MILVVRLPNWLGDTVMAAPTVEALRAGLPPDDRIAVAGPWAQLLTGQGLAEWSVTYPRSWRGRLRTADTVARVGADTVLVLPHSFEAALAAWYWGARRRIGYDTGERGWLLTERLPLPRDPVHQVDEYLALLAPLGIEPVTRQPRLRGMAGEEIAAEVARLLAGTGATPPIVGIHLGAAFGPSKVPPAEAIAALCASLRRRGLAPLLLGAPADLEFEQRVQARAGASVPSLVGRDRPEQLPTLLTRLGAFVSGDTGTAHLAAALGTPVITLFGPTDPVRSAPRGRATLIAGNVPCAPCFYARCPIDHPCMRAIDPDEVAEAAAASVRAA
jgi:lipopolysaccharide heptosyltransferase II